MRSVLLCPGQGAQYVGMGKDLAERFPRARDVFRAADETLDVSLSRIMWEGPEEELTLTHNAQPAILVHTLAVHAVIGDVLEPVAAAGHSLGEYSAYAALAWLATGDAVRLVRRRGELMLEAGKRREGAMAAVIGLDPEQVDAICREASDDGRVVVPANLNAPGQVVISGDPSAVERAGALLKEAGAKRVMLLKVSGAFHSPLMEPAGIGLRAELDRARLREGTVPVIANASGTAVSDVATARCLLGEQLTAPVRWVESMRTALAMAGEAWFVEMGPGAVLAGLLKRVDRGAVSASLGTADEVEAFLERGA